jgi:predicted peroxiredoxin
MDDPDFSDAEKNVILGQAYFFRAYQYMQLARIFGDIPLHLSTDDDDIYKPQSSQEEVYAQVEADMLLAEALLPTEHSTNFLTRSRGTKGAAQTMLAKLYAETRDFQKCADYAAKVINSGVYELVDTFDHLFDGEHEFNSESIWEGVHVSGGFQQGTYAQLQMLPPGDFSQYGDKPGSSWTVAYPRFNTLHSDLVTAFETMGDTVRANSSYITVSDRSLISTPSYGYSDSEPISHVYKLGRVGEFTSGHNIMLLRLADVILLRAEALNQLGNTGEAITLLNQVRARVELAPTTATSKADVAKAILDERRLELFMENSRYWDLKRYYNDDAAFVQYLNSLTESDGTSLEYKATLNNIFMPIPQKEMDINEYLVQRPGY